MDGECVGVTDGSYVFDPALAGVQEKIKAENDRIAGQPHVTVALLLQFDAPTAGNVTIERIRSQTEGAYIAQRNENASGAHPKIKLVLANKGSQEQAWKPVAEQLAGMDDPPDQLVAVIGLGVSSVPTAEGAKMLSSKGIPMIGAVTTADELNSERIPGLTRVSSGVGDQLALVAEYLEEHRRALKTAMLVNDSNPNDLYTSSMRANFAGKGKPLATYWENGGGVVQPYDGAPGSPGIVAQFDAIVANLCGVDPPDMVFYAGRAALLPNFIERLRQRTCLRDRTITVVTGPDASALANTLSVPDELDAPVSVLFAPQSYPGALRDRRWNPDVAQYVRFEESFTASGFPLRDLADGWAIATHDAMLAAAKAVQRVTGPGADLPTKTDVRSMLYASNTPVTSIPGAGGTFTFHPTRGDAVGRRSPVMELRPDGTLRLLGVYDQPVRR